MKHYTLTISNDIDPENPLTWDDFEIFTVKNDSRDKIEEYLTVRDGEVVGANVGMQRKLDCGTMFIVSTYEHGAITYGLQGEVHKCRWDSSDVAGVLIWSGKAKDLGSDREDRETRARGTLETYTQWANGECYGFQITQEGSEEEDSCWGFYDKENMINHVLGYIGKNWDCTIDIQGEASHFLDMEDLREAHELMIKNAS